MASVYLTTDETLAALVRMPDRIPGSALGLPTLRPLALLGSGVGGPCVVALGSGVTADAGVLLADAVILVPMTTPLEEKQ